MIRTTLLSLLVLLFFVSCSLASELEPVMFVTGVVKKDDLAEVQAELARERKIVAEKMEKAVTQADAAALAEAAGNLARITAREEALAEDVAHANQQVKDFGSVLANTIKQELGCTQVIQDEDLTVYFGRQRESAQARTGTDADPLDGDNNREPEAEYEVKVTATVSFDKDQAGPVELVANCTHKKTSTVLASVATSRGGGDSLPGLADTFVGQMARFEVCPYLGTVSVSSDLTKNPRSRTERQAYCNNRDGQYFRDNKEHSVSKEQWKLEKTGRRAGSGDVDYNGLEKFDESEENDCYKCPSGMEGHRVYTRKITKDFKISGLSDESAGRKGETVNKDSRVRIRFLDSGASYMLKIDAVSKNGTELVDLKEKASGVCDTIDRNPPPEEKARDAHLSGEWGPFRGSPMDKQLADTIEVPLNNPTIGETGKRIIHFELSRK